MGNPIFEETAAISHKGKQGGDYISLNNSGMITVRMNGQSHLNRATRWGTSTQETNVSGLDPYINSRFSHLLQEEHHMNHPIRDYLHRAEMAAVIEQPQPEQTMTQMDLNLQDIILRQLRPRQESAVGSENTTVDYARSSANVEHVRYANMVSAMGRLRRNIRATAENSLGNDLLHHRLDEEEPRDRLNATRETYLERVSRNTEEQLEASRTTRRTRYERRQMSESRRRALQVAPEQREPRSRTSTEFVTDSFHRWATNRRLTNQQETVSEQSATLINAVPVTSSNAINILTAREIYTQTALRLARTRELLSARQDQHTLLSQRLQESTRALDTHIDNIRNAISLVTTSRMQLNGGNIFPARQLQLIERATDAQLEDFLVAENQPANIDDDIEMSD